MTTPERPGVVFEGVWKRFRRGEIHDSLRDLLPALSRRLFGRRETSAADGHFWALRDVSFRVEPGEVLGIIGGNGAGKSTALKILTKILRPSAGVARVRGRIGALIEVSAGFHQDLTGRENIFLQGSIMGMPVTVIRRKFDEIVEFAGVEEFIDTPVKRYSSGMNARLGFSIAAHLDPDVLIIDEVLSVGDFRFQEKAFDRIHTMSRSGIPVVLVSHQLDRVAALCSSVVVLQQGRVLFQGEVNEGVDTYLSGGAHLVSGQAESAPVRLGACRILQGQTIQWGDPTDLEVDAVISGPERTAFDSIGIRIRALEGGREVFRTSTRFADIALPERGPVRCRISFRNQLPTGTYTIEPFVWRVGVEEFFCTGPISTFHAETPATPLGRGTVNLSPAISVSIPPPAHPPD